MAEFRYMASVAQLSTEISITYDGVVVQFSGFDDSMPNYISETFKRMIGMKTASLEEVFNQQKAELIKELQNNYYD